MLVYVHKIVCILSLRYFTPVASISSKTHFRARVFVISARKSRPLKSKSLDSTSYTRSKPVGSVVGAPKIEYFLLWLAKVKILSLECVQGLSWRNKIHKLQGIDEGYVYIYI